MGFTFAVFFVEMMMLTDSHTSIVKTNSKKCNPLETLACIYNVGDEQVNPGKIFNDFPLVPHFSFCTSGPPY